MRMFSLALLLFAVMVGQPVQAATRYLYGDNAGTGTVTPIKPTLWAMNASQPVKQATGDTVYQGSLSLLFSYDLSALDSTKTPLAPRNWSGVTWVWGYPFSANMTGADYVRFAYKLPNAKHKLVVNITCLDSLTKVCKDTTCVDSIFATRSTSDTSAAVGGVGTAGKAGWVLDSIPIAAWGDSLLLNAVNGIQFIVQYKDTNDKSSTTGLLQLDEICFTNVLTGVRIPFNGHAPVSGSRRFNSNGLATITTYSVLGKVLGSESVQVNAGEQCSDVVNSARLCRNGATVIRISGAGVDAKTMILR